MRLIDADKIVYSWQIDADGQEHDGVTLKSIIDKIPTIDTKIIHCVDCKYKDDGIDENGIQFLKCLHGRSYGGTRINDYCSWAEKREE